VRGAAGRGNLGKRMGPGIFHYLVKSTENWLRCAKAPEVLIPFSIEL
jgi:hypothetical protein